MSLFYIIERDCQLNRTRNTNVLHLGETVSALLSGKKDHCVTTTVAPGHLLRMPRVSYFLFPVLYSRSLISYYFVYESVYMSIPTSQFIPPTLSPLLTIDLFSAPVTLLLFCK